MTAQGLSAFMRYVSSGGRPKVPGSMPVDYADLMQRCWSGSVAERPPFHAIVKELQRQVEQTGGHDVGRGVRGDGEELVQIGAGGAGSSSSLLPKGESRR